MNGTPGETPLARRLIGLRELLAEHRSLWEPRPFLAHTLPWEADHPALSAYLRALESDTIEVLERQLVPELPVRLAPWRPRILELIALVPLRPRPVRLHPKQRRKMPGRKVRQVEGFVGALLDQPVPGTILVDWCAGKAHLGRAAALALDRRLVVLEKDPALCDAARKRCAQDGVEAEVICGSALDTTVLDPDRFAVALHACGHLTDALFRQVVETDAAGAVCVPCCCHRVGAEGVFQPMSTEGRGLPLSSPQLRLATAEQLAGEPGKRRRDMAWRLGLDLLLREATGDDRFHEVRKQRRSVFRGDFGTYARQAAELAGITLAPFDGEEALAAGWERARTVAALALVRAQFRRALELYVWLDRARFLEEAGFEVEIRQLFPRDVTPRNVWIRAYNAD